MSIIKGDLDIYPIFVGSMEWDTYASQIIVEEAGGIIQKINSRGKLEYNKKI